MDDKADSMMNDKEKCLTKVALGIATMFGIYWMYLLLRDKIHLSAGIKTLIGLICLYGVGFSVYWSIIKKVPGGKPAKSKVSWKTLGLCFLLQFTAIMFLSVITNVLTALGVIKTTVDMDTTSLYSLFMLLIFNPIAEELVFRKTMADKLLQYGELFYMLVSSFCFAIVHGVSLGIPQILYTFILGMIWSFVMVKTGDIRLVIGLHALSNLCGSIVVKFLMGISMMAAGMYSLLLMILGAVGLILFLKNKKRLSIDEKNTVIRPEVFQEIFRNKGIWIYSGITILFMVII
ncbi:MAG: CPBP family intramembrane metalloprotease [Lachnospiraceae bacterium]|nr:CPBP family intramembrane metalloprotease [Lachnospiraceae bacterium]